MWRASETMRPKALCYCKARRRKLGGNGYLLRVRKVRSFPWALSCNDSRSSLEHAQFDRASKGLHALRVSVLQGLGEGIPGEAAALRRLRAS